MRAYGLRTHIWNNRWKSALLLAGFPLLLALAAFGMALVFNDDPRGFDYALRSALDNFPFYLAGGAVGAAIWFAIAWIANQRIIDAVTGARRVTRAEEPALWDTLEALCISRGITMPKLAIIETPQRNAYASGLSRQRGMVTVTRGLLAALSPEELRAVLAHELTHIRNGDARLLVVAAVFAGIIGLVMQIFFRGLRFRAGRRGNPLAMMLGVALIALAWGLGVLLRFALSRNREYLADAGAVELTQDPDAMIAALRRIEGRSAMKAVPAEVRAMFFDDPPASSFWSGLTATHPPIEARVAALVEQAGGRDPGVLPDPVAEPPAAEAATINPWAQTAAPAPGSPWGAPTAAEKPASPWWRGR